MRRCGSAQNDTRIQRSSGQADDSLRLSNSASVGQRLSKKRQALVHPVIDAGMVVGELLVAMPDPKLIQPSYEPPRAVEQVELVLFAAIDVKGFQPAKIIRLAFDRGDGILPRPVRPALLISSQVSIVTGSLMPRNCVGSGS